MVTIVTLKKQYSTIDNCDYMNKEITTIQITKELRDMLKEFGKKGDTYEDIIKRLVKTMK